MSDNWMHFFPADPLQPKPDWPRLRDKLLDCGLILEPRGADIPAETVVSLWQCIVGVTGLPQSGSRRTASLDDLVGLLSSAQLPVDRWTLDTDRLTIPEFVAALRGCGVLPADFVFSGDERYQPGALFEGLCEVPHARYGWNDTYLYPQDFGDRIGIEVGENMLIPPGIPGSDRVVDDWSAFLKNWLNDPNQRWIDPETEAAYGLLDLDWENSLGAGRFMLSVFSPGYLNGERTAGLLSELAGQPFRYSRQHI
jgi:hypothetical protein